MNSPVSIRNKLTIITHDALGSLVHTASGRTFHLGSVEERVFPAFDGKRNIADVRKLKFS